MHGSGYFYPALTGSKTSTLKSSECRDEVGRLTARKSPIGSTNNQWGGTTPPPLIKVSLYP
ncbi:hypothetical protein BK702_21715 [Bacillus thuringiensis serovar cameroun]|nr:hypothetical protein BK702_21715 [Bacillus thuringiensis serovar cameroun]